jgi:hypothetical protein
MRKSITNVYKGAEKPIQVEPAPIFDDLKVGDCFRWNPRGGYRGNNEVLKKLDGQSYVNLQSGYYETQTCQEDWIVTVLDIEIYYTEVE